MTPEQDQMLKEVYAWMQARRTQQIAEPIDDASRIALEVVLGPAQVEGLGTATLTQVYSVSGSSITGPKAYSDTILIRAQNGTVYEVPIVAINP